MAPSHPVMCVSVFVRDVGSIGSWHLHNVLAPSVMEGEILILSERIFKLNLRHVKYK